MYKKIDNCDCCIAGVHVIFLLRLKFCSLSYDRIFDIQKGVPPVYMYKMVARDKTKACSSL